MKAKKEIFVTEPSRKIPVVTEADVVVIGGGPGGVPAAIAAARKGMTVLVIEHYGFLGGLSTAGQIGPLFGFSSAQDPTRILDGIPVEIVRELQSLGGAPDESSLNWHAIPFYPEMLKHAYERISLKEKNISLLFHTHAVAIIKEDNRIDSVIVENKSGRSAIRGKIFIDATGDGDIASFAGCDYTKGREADGLTQPMGTKFRIGGVRTVTPEEREKGTEEFRKAMDSHQVPAYHTFAGEVSEGGSTLRAGEDTPTCTRSKGDGTNASDLSASEIKLRADTLEIMEFCKKNVPGYESAYLMETPAQIGVRETRQVTGDYILTGKECLAEVRYEDAIARGSWFLDIHCPRGLSCVKTNVCDMNCETDPKCYMKTKFKDMMYENLLLRNGGYYEIPYRSITPKGIDNLMISGRCISADHGAMSSLRVIGTCMAIGQAVGAAAAMSIEQNCSPRELDGVKVRKALVSDGVPL